MQELVSYCSSLCSCSCWKLCCFEERCPVFQDTITPRVPDPAAATGHRCWQPPGGAVHKTLLASQIWGWSKLPCQMLLVCLLVGLGGINQAVNFPWSPKIIFSLLYQATPSVTLQKSTFLEGDRWGYLIDYIYPLFWW